jgi:CRP/FNR family transcriptional regulator, cyclic AMP receptor protein
VQQARIEALQRMPIFGGIRADILDFLVQSSTALAVKKGEYFFRQGDQAQSMFVLEGGEVEILKIWDGEEHLLRRLRQGDCFGEMALMDLFPRSASVRALEDCTAIELSAASLYRVYERDVEQFAMIQMNMGREVSRRLRVADDHLFLARVGEPYRDPGGSFPST